jgi:hypothetical protein
MATIPPRNLPDEVSWTHASNGTLDLEEILEQAAENAVETVTTADILAELDRTRAGR